MLKMIINLKAVIVLYQLYKNKMYESFVHYSLFISFF